MAEHFDSFDEMMSSLEKKKRTIHLLLGNGFSRSYDEKIFSYNALFDFVNSLKDEELAAVFAAMKTKNFELMMEQLNASLALIKALGGDLALEKSISNVSEKLKHSLLDAIKALHPEHVFKVAEERSASCAKFLRRFLGSGGSLITTNYDLLLYWVLMRQGLGNEAPDGFGRELLNPVELQSGSAEGEWSELRWGFKKEKQRVYYLHGALPLFDTGSEIVKEQYREAEGYILENIGKRLENDEYPIFVTAGNSDEKLVQIRHNRYLSDCYDHLCELDGSVVSLGFGFGSYDHHVVEALNKANRFRMKVDPKLRSVYIGVHSDADRTWIQSIEGSFHAKVYTFDARTAHIWDA